MSKRIACWLSILLLLTTPLAIAEAVTVRSGNGNVGARDSSITLLLGPADSDFSKAFTPSDFSNAQNGPAAFILSPVFWVSGLSEDSSAKWIGTNGSANSYQGNTALYAVRFTIANAFSAAALTMHYAVDDDIGSGCCGPDSSSSATNPGLYLNGTAICSSLIANSSTNFTQEHTLTCDNIAPLLHVGTNWFYIDAVNLEAMAGLLFSATITTVEEPPVSASPSSLSFDVIQGSNPAPQTVQVSGGAAGLSFSAQASSSGWLSISPTSGTPPANVTVSVNSTNLSPGTYNGTILVVGTAGATGQTTINVTLTVTTTLPTIMAVVNAASYARSSVVSPGEIVTIFGTNIGPATPAGLALDPGTGMVATLIGGVQVLFNGILAPMVYASSMQVSAVVPYETAGIATPPVWIKYSGRTSNAFQLTSVTTAPGLFTQNSSGSGPGSILNQDNSVNGPNNPATKSSIVQVFLTGEGQTSPHGVTGAITTATLPPPQVTPAPLLSVGVLINGQPALYTYAGEAPGLVAGVMQLNVQIPSNAQSGNLPITVSIGGNTSQNNVTVSVR